MIAYLQTYSFMRVAIFTFLCYSALSATIVKKLRLQYDMMPLKEILQSVKLDRSLAGEACQEISNILSHRKVESAKEAMNAISIYKIGS